MSKYFNCSPQDFKQVIWIHEPDFRHSQSRLLVEYAKDRQDVWYAPPYCKDISKKLFRKNCSIRTIFINLDSDTDVHYKPFFRFLILLKKGFMRMNGREHQVPPVHIVVLSQFLPFELDRSLCKKCFQDDFKIVHFDDIEDDNVVSNGSNGNNEQ